LPKGKQLTLLILEKCGGGGIFEGVENNGGIMKKLILVILIVLNISLTQKACASNNIIPLSEREALLQIYKSLHGDQWRYKQGWNGEYGTEQGWYGVTVEKIDGAMHVVRLVIGEDLYKYRSNLIAGKLPSAIGNLRYLRHLIIRGSKTEGKLPTELFGLEHLEYLDIAFNDISGEVSTALFSMQQLKYLDMRYTGFTGSLPSEITSPLWYCHLSDGFYVTRRVLTLHNKRCPIQEVRLQIVWCIIRRLIIFVFVQPLT